MHKIGGMILEDTIIALATPPGTGAISVIRISGDHAVAVCASCFEAAGGRKLAKQKSHTLHLGHIKDGERIIDEVLVSLFKAPHSYTGEEVVEISCHGSVYIQQEILQLFLRKGCRMATAGEFTLRAFLNGKMDLSQAEAVADLIASNSEAAHKVAMQQMRGGFSEDIKTLRGELLHFASLIELELDFAEEDVAFADREALQALLIKIRETVRRLAASFATGNVIKNGIPVAIAGAPNVGKSTLLNGLLNEERAIVSEIAGTTRDTVEDEISLGGMLFRFIDTAGIRDTEDVVERIGVQKTFEKMAQAQVIIYLFDLVLIQNSEFRIQNLKMEMGKLKAKFPDKALLIVANKTDALRPEELTPLKKQLQEIIPAATGLLFISAREKQGIDELKERLLSYVNTGALQQQETIVTNVRHYEILLKVLQEIGQVETGLASGLSGDLLAIAIRQALHYLGEITGQVTQEDVLGNIFANFCIGK